MLSEATGDKLVCQMECDPPCWGDMRPLQRWCSSLAFQVSRAALEAVPGLQGSDEARGNGPRRDTEPRRPRPYATARIYDWDGMGVQVVFEWKTRDEGNSDTAEDDGDDAGGSAPDCCLLSTGLSSESCLPGAQGRRKAAGLAEVEGWLGDAGEPAPCGPFGEEGATREAGDAERRMSREEAYPDGGRGLPAEAYPDGGCGEPPTCVRDTGGGCSEHGGEEAANSSSGDEASMSALGDDAGLSASRNDTGSAERTRAAQDTGSAAAACLEQGTSQQTRARSADARAGGEMTQMQRNDPPSRAKGVGCQRGGRLSLRLRMASQGSILYPAAGNWDSGREAFCGQMRIDTPAGQALEYSAADAACAAAPVARGPHAPCARCVAPGRDGSRHDGRDGSRQDGRDGSSSQRDGSRHDAASWPAAAHESSRAQTLCTSRVQNAQGASALSEPRADKSGDDTLRAAKQLEDDGSWEAGCRATCGTQVEAPLGGPAVAGRTRAGDPRPREHVRSSDTAAAVEAVVAMCAAGWLKPAVMAVRGGAAGDAAPLWCTLCPCRVQPWRAFLV